MNDQDKNKEHLIDKVKDFLKGNEKDHEKDHVKDIEKDTEKDHEKDIIPKINKAALGATATEAWADAESVDKNTKMNFPSEEAVEDAKDWVDENEK